jgi:hypothetical protein
MTVLADHKTTATEHAIYVDGNPEPVVVWNLDATPEAEAQRVKAATVFADLKRTHVMHTGPLDADEQVRAYDAALGVVTATGPQQGG